MSIGKKIYLHIFGNAVMPALKGGAQALKATEGKHEAVQTGAVAVGVTVGAVFGALKVLSPVQIYDTIVTSESTMEERISTEFEDE